ncbi:MFS transporter [Streptomyces sp. NPDC090106]|uniref:MFS transporter n=1 Tax=Streptomyces sp. NPDC090106 TaxID=3365946 RepID=UPI0038251954
MVEQGAHSTPAHLAGQSSRRWWILAVVIIGQLLVVLDTTMMNIALPSAQADLGFSDGARGWIVSAYTLAFGSLLLLGGRIGDLFGRKVTFLTGVAGFGIASAIAGAAPNFAVLVTARVAEGAFAALLAPITLAIVSVTFTDVKERSKALGLFGAISAGGSAIGLLLGGVLTENMSWRWVPYTNVVLAVITFFAGVALLVKIPRDAGAKLDILGTALVCTGLFGLVYGLSNVTSHGWGSLYSWGYMVGGVVLVTLFVVWQTRAPHPLLPLRVLLDRNRSASYLATLVNGVGMFGVFLFMSYFLQQNLQFSPIRSGVAFLPMVAGLVVGSVISTAILLPRISPKFIVPVGMAISTIGVMLLTTLDIESTYASSVVVPLIVTGFGLGFIVAPAMGLGVTGVDNDDSGAASAAVNTANQIGGSLGTALLTTLFTTAMQDNLAGKDPMADPLALARASVDSYTTVFAWVAGLFAAGFLVTVLLYRRGVAAAGPVLPESQ